MSNFRRTDIHPEGTMALTHRDNMQWPLSRYLACLTNLDSLNQAMCTAYSQLQRKPDDTKAQLRYGGLELIRDTDNGEVM